ncbi:MAG: hypothetical protein ACOCP4_01810 [Candidatus Woesearchaeota archaeon]
MEKSIKEEKDDMHQEEIHLTIGNMKFSIFYSENVLFMKAEEPQLDWISSISYAQKKEGIKVIIWDNKEGVITNLSRNY